MKKILILLLIAGCNNYHSNNNNFKRNKKEAIMDTKDKIYPIKVNVVNVSGRDFFIQGKDEFIELKFDNIENKNKDSNKKLLVKFSIEKGKGTLYFRYKKDYIIRKILPVDKQVDFPKDVIWEYEPKWSDKDITHKLVFEITTDEGNKTQTDVCFNEKFYNHDHVREFGEFLKTGSKTLMNTAEGYIEIYLSKGKDINGTYKSNGLIHQWVNIGNHYRSILNKLIDSGADLNIKNNKGKTPLMNAC